MTVPETDWSGRRGSNPRPSAWEADILPLNYSRSLPFDYTRTNRGQQVFALVQVRRGAPSLSGFPGTRRCERQGPALGAEASGRVGHLLTRREIPRWRKVAAEPLPTLDAHAHLAQSRTSMEPAGLQVCPRHALLFGPSRAGGMLSRTVSASSEGDEEFYRKIAGATPIPDSFPGAYRNVIGIERSRQASGRESRNLR